MIVWTSLHLRLSAIIKKTLKQKKSLIDFYSGLTEERKEKFNDLVATLNALLVQNQE